MITPSHAHVHPRVSKVYCYDAQVSFNVSSFAELCFILYLVAGRFSKASSNPLLLCIPVRISQT